MRRLFVWIFVMLFRRLLFSVVLLCCPLTLACGEEPSIWSVDAFTVTAEEALQDAANNAVQEDADVEILWDEGRYSIDAEGRKTTVLRQIYHIRNRSAIDQWNVIQHVWKPWFQHEPDIRARVIGPD